MKLIHSLGILNLSKDTNDSAGFLLTNKRGSYSAFFSKQDSRYYGFFYFDPKAGEMYKIIENIEIAGNDEVFSIGNLFYSAERKKNGAIEFFHMPNGLNTLIYELSTQEAIDLILDCRKSYDNREFGRYYDVLEEEGTIVVKFTKKTDKREDNTEGNHEFSMFLAIKSDGQKFEKNDKWTEREYHSDEKRNSPPFRRHVYNALRLHGSKFVFSASKDKSRAIKEAVYVFENADELKRKEKEYFLKIINSGGIGHILANKKISDEIKIAYLNALNSLNNLLASCNGSLGIMAGLPWFFQIWARDSVISLKAVSKIDKRLSEKIIRGYLNKISNEGRIPNLIGPGAKKGSADAVGWLFLRCRDIIESINKNRSLINSIKDSMHVIKQNRHSKNIRIMGYLKRCSSIINKKENEYHKVIYEIESALEKSMSGLPEKHTKDNFEINGPQETWMDTSFGDDGRAGIRIEIQALRLDMYRLMYNLTLSHKYRILENTLRIKLRRKLWNGKILADGLNDFTIRPNVFIAAYAYKELLSSKEWEACFENALEALWLDWGGLSTIDKNNKLFSNTNTGEDSRSYHHGDSWFWLNNLAAIELNKINKNKFKSQIRKIISASTDDILWKGCIGCASELSSAKEFLPTGCFNQAWSNAMYMELIDEVFK